MYLCLSLKGSGHFVSHWNLGKNYVVCVEIGYGISSFQQTREWINLADLVKLTCELVSD